MALPDALHADLLYFFLFGPGTGETVLLRVPPNRWLVVDSFKCAKRPAAEPIIRTYGGEVAAVVLTHPHADHHAGVLEMIDAYPRAALGCVHPRDSAPAAAATPDPVAAINECARPTYDRIWTEWNRDASRRWATFRQTSWNVGEAKVTSLHPVDPVDPRAWNPQRLNELASALLVEWHGLRLLLAPTCRTRSGRELFRRFPAPGLNNHAAMKVPHHGSREAIHGGFGEGPATRLWVVTPFRGKGLPRAVHAAPCAPDGPEGLARILSYVQEVNLTSLPFSHDCEHLEPCVTTRQAIRDGRNPRRTRTIDADFTATTACLDRHVIVAFDQSGAVRELRHGRGAVVIRDEPAV